MTAAYPLLKAFGIESEYMIVDRETLAVKPLSDRILAEMNGGEVVNEVECGDVNWSNEVVCHVLEVKFAEPAPTTDGWDRTFHNAVRDMNARLAEHGCMLLPSAMHPFMDPETETVLWSHGQNEIYDAYDRIFGCKGHGWSNLQSVHINISFKAEDEFRRLHSAIRLVLPLIPYLAASSPYHDGKAGDSLDCRLGFYEANQKKIPIITGDVVPEAVQDFAGYDAIYRKLYAAIAPHDPNGTLQHPWLNSRGAIPKFDVGAIEIRIMDIQECPYMDFALISFVTAAIRALVDDPETLAKGDTLTSAWLKDIYLQSRQPEPAALPPEYCALFNSAPTGFNDLCRILFKNLSSDIPQDYHAGINLILDKGNLATRLLRASGDIAEKYKSLARCLADNAPYSP